MKAWDAFLRDVRPLVPGVPAPHAEHAVRRAAQDFCRLTRAWKVALDPIQFFPGADEYDLPLEQDVELVRIESATFGGEPFGVWRDEPEAPHGAYVSTSDGRTLRFSSAQRQDTDLVLTCSVMPSERANGIDDSIFARYCSVISSRAVAILLNDAVRTQAFEQRCADIRVDLWRGNARANPRARACFF